MRRSRLARLGTCASQAWNVLWFDGNPDETVSARSWREGMLQGNAKWKARRKRINRWFREPDHCRRSHEIDLAHAREVLGGAS